MMQAQACHEAIKVITYCRQWSDLRTVIRTNKK